MRAIAAGSGARYADLSEIYEELEATAKLHKRLGCPVIDVTPAGDRGVRRALRGAGRGAPPGAFEGAPATAALTRWVYDFSEGSADMRSLLGGKGANLAEMTRDRAAGARRLHHHHRGLRRHLREGGSPDGLDEQVAEHLAALEQRTGKRLGARTRPAAGLGALGRRRSRCPA